MTDHSKGSFFGRRVGKPLRAQRREVFEAALQRLQPDLALPAPQDPRDLFSGEVDTVWMEIGFGGGEHLLHEAQRLPATGFIGAEPFVSSLAKAVVEIETQELANVRVYGDDAIKLLDWLPDASLDGIYQLYPDPWPKRRHWKRRFVNPVNLDRMARVLKPGALYRFASDIDTYVDWTLARLLTPSGLRMDGGRGVRLAGSLAALVGHALRGEGLSGGAQRPLSRVPKAVAQGCGIRSAGEFSCVWPLSAYSEPT